MNQITKKEKRWILQSETTPESEAAVKKIATDLKINCIVAQLLYNRGYQTTSAAKSFLFMESEIICNPFDMKDMDKATERVNLAIKRREKITIYGDYDVDGVTSVCTLYLYLKSKGAVIDYYIPNRSGEGYGVSNTAIDNLKDSGTSLIITVDTGTTAIEEVEYAKSIGVDFIVTDHHECRTELPDACAIINPHRPDCQYPFKELAGVGVVFKFVSAYEEKYTPCSRIEAAMNIFSEYSDLVAIGTIADVMPIKAENRLIVSYGLNKIEKNKRSGLTALMDAAAGKNDSSRNDKRRKKAKITTGYIGYTLAPRINAAGRIRSAMLSVELFLSNDFNRANHIAKELCEANKERQAEENKIMLEAYDIIEQNNMQNDKVIVLSSDGWHHGVIGIVASRITEKYSRPTILVSFDKADSENNDGNVGKGSGRSIKGLNLVDALCYCSDHLVKFGGHELAAGLSVTRDELPLFRKKINEYAEQNLSEEALMPTMDADCVINMSDISLSLAEDLQILEPYGVGNTIPNFIVRGVNVSEISSVSDGRHSRITFGEGRNTVSSMFFSNPPSSLGIYAGDVVDILFNIDINEWMGRRSVQLIIKDIRISSDRDSQNKTDKQRFTEIWSGDSFDKSENVLPDREDFACVYRYVSNSIRSGTDTLTVRDIQYGIAKSHETRNIGYIKLRIIIKIFQELNLIGIEELSEERFKFKIQYSSSKTDLEKSSLLRRIRNQQSSK